jgi:hypothetical protein
MKKIITVAKNGNEIFKQPQLTIFCRYTTTGWPLGMTSTRDLSGGRRTIRHNKVKYLSIPRQTSAQFLTCEANPML